MKTAKVSPSNDLTYTVATFGLWQNNDSSICTTTPGPPNCRGAFCRSFQLQMKVLIYLYCCSFCDLCFLSSTCHWILSTLPVHQYQSDSLNSFKKVPALDKTLLWQLVSGQCHLKTDLIVLKFYFSYNFLYSISHVPMLILYVTSYLNFHLTTTSWTDTISSL